MELAMRSMNALGDVVAAVKVNHAVPDDMSGPVGILGIQGDSNPTKGLPMEPLAYSAVNGCIDEPAQQSACHRALNGIEAEQVANERCKFSTPKDPLVKAS